MNFILHNPSFPVRISNLCLQKYKTDLPKGFTQNVYINTLTAGRNSNRIAEWISHSQSQVLWRYTG